ncbi:MULTISPECIES: metallophosphoesterase family protein [unclassified Corynebacterium]|uniref:metallophosphoesterase family protein n=1 Tax=unclassified Corynebacterium TaxID=2624378 RepID=UPI0030A78636
MSISRRAYLSVATLAAGSINLAKTTGANGIVRFTSSFGLTPSDVEGMVVRATDLEVATITSTSVTFTWATYAPGVSTPYGFAKPTVPAGELVKIGPVDSYEMHVMHDRVSDSGYHHVTINGLEPGRTYRFECWSDGVRAVPSLAVTKTRTAPEMTGTFTTLPALEGAYVGTIAVTNDTHIGKPYHDGIRIEGVGLTSGPDEDPFAAMQLEGLLRTVKADGIDTVVVNGDCTDHNEPEEYDEFKRIMNTFGEQDKNWFVTRGNHDNHLPGTPHTNGSIGRAIRSGKVEVPDYFSEHFTPTQQHWSTQIGELRLMGLDTATFGIGGGYISPDQMDAVRTELFDDPDRPTLLFGHHPVTYDAMRSHLGGEAFMLPRAQSQQLQATLSKASGVKAMFAGHTHRSRRGKADVGTVDYCERGAALGYPGGYTQVRVHTDGYQVTYHRTRTEQSLTWSTRTRWSMLGFEPELMLGRASDRNYIVQSDLSGLR